MKRYLIDTKIWIPAFHRGNELIQHKMDSVPMEQCWISSVAVAELFYGVENSSKPKENRHSVNAFLDTGINVLPFTIDHAESFGAIRYMLKRAGNLIGPYDMMMAAQASAEQMVLVTNNTKEFERIPSIELEDWTERA
jgi:tRNA(fMet)-specific endonuclease VapC